MFTVVDALMGIFMHSSTFIGDLPAQCCRYFVVRNTKVMNKQIRHMPDYLNLDTSGSQPCPVLISEC